MEDNSDVVRSARLLSEIYRLANELSAPEQVYILEMIKLFQKLRHSPFDDRN